MQNLVIIPGDSLEPRLAPEEIDEFFRYCYAIHDHSGLSTEPIFWYRTEGDLHLSRFWN